jgi:hypothetical protein
MEIALMDDAEISEKEAAETFWLLWTALIYQDAADKYQNYIEDWGKNTTKLLGLN